MKKFIAFTVVVLVLWACNNEEEKFITLSEPGIYMYYKSTKQLDIMYSTKKLDQQRYTYSSTNEHVATVSRTGLVTGVSLGEAVINVVSSDGKYAAECKVTIAPKSSFYKEPYLAFGVSKQEVKERETREILFESENLVVFDGVSDYMPTVQYAFKKDKLSGAFVQIFSVYQTAAELLAFLSERYKYVEDLNGYTVFEHRTLNIRVELTDHPDYGFLIYYYPKSITPAALAADRKAMMSKLKQYR